MSFQDIRDSAKAGTLEGYRKIRLTCQQALQDGLNYAWVDTCCIDKASSAELSKAINSMYRWYADSEVCYAYLEDISTISQDGRGDSEEDFKRSRWHTRGWTLQELLAPRNVIFYSSNWTPLGTKTELASILSVVSGIDEHVLIEPDWLASYTIAQRMCWAAHRNTTQPEDQAYCLFDIMGVNMPLLYGEGEKAFARLQGEIIRSQIDHSIFLWKTGTRTSLARQFARSPADFSDCSRVIQTNTTVRSTCQASPLGLHVSFPVVKWGSCWFAILDCRYADDFRGPLGLQIEFDENLQNMGKEKGAHVLCPSSEDESFTVVPVEVTKEAVLQDLVLLNSFNFRSHESSLDCNFNLWLQTEQSGTEGFELVEAWPPERWNAMTRVMHWPASAYSGELFACLVFCVPAENQHLVVAAMNYGTLSTNDWRLNVTKSSSRPTRNVVQSLSRSSFWRLRTDDGSEWPRVMLDHEVSFDPFLAENEKSFLRGSRVTAVVKRIMGDKVLIVRMRQ